MNRAQGLRSSRLGLALAAVAASPSLLACTYLITFDHVDVADAGVDAGPAAPKADAAPSAGPDGASDAGLETLDACVGKVDGHYCGNNQLMNYPGSKDDLVTCGAGSVASITHCKGGTGCRHMPNPNPDECDECQDRDDGFYCGRDMPGWAEANTNILVQCQAHGIANTTLCARCVSNGAASSCP